MNHISKIFQPYMEPRSFIIRRKGLKVNEREMLALTFGIALLSFLANAIDLSFSDVLLKSSQEDFGRLITSYFAVAVFFVPIFLYIVSGLFHFLMWLVYKIELMSLSRLTFFWALLLCMPFQLFVTLMIAFMNIWYTSIFFNLCVFVYFIWLWSVFNSEIFKIDKTIKIFTLKLMMFSSAFLLVLVI